ncbi:MAG: hypothetical protein KDA80_23670 [Planctomycetaceae bacterium]|nr:hypothetical protein [Planctomycetaceae bacterium]
MSESPTKDSPEQVSSDKEHRRRSGWWYRLEVTFLDALIFWWLYVFSIGPMYWQWYAAKYIDGSPLLAAFYEPLFFVAGTVPFFGSWLDWYISWWTR